MKEEIIKNHNNVFGYICIDLGEQSENEIMEKVEVLIKDYQENVFSYQTKKSNLFKSINIKVAFSRAEDIVSMYMKFNTKLKNQYGDKIKVTFSYNIDKEKLNEI